jgi:hypothetical protein
LKKPDKFLPNGAGSAENSDIQFCHGSFSRRVSLRVQKKVWMNRGVLQSFCVTLRLNQRNSARTLFRIIF